MNKAQIKILQFGKKEFLEHGYKDASLNKIIAKTGYTKGAFYGYYKDKAALFYDLTDCCAEEFISMFKAAQQSFFDLIPTDDTKNSMAISQQYLKCFIDYIFSKKDEFKLILCCSAGTKHEHFVDRLVDLQVENTLLYHEELHRHNKLLGRVDKTLFHILVSAQYESLFEIVRHDIPKDEALQYIDKISIFFIAGFSTLFKYE